MTSTSGPESPESTKVNANTEEAWGVLAWTRQRLRALAQIALVGRQRMPVIFVGFAAWYQRARRIGAIRAFFDQTYGAPPAWLGDDLMAAGMPGEPPHFGRLGPEVYNLHLEMGSSELQARAMAWSAAIKETIETAAIEVPIETERFLRRVAPRLTTYGFVQMGEGVRLAAIFYVRPRDALKSGPTRVQVGTEIFPVVVRPHVRVDHTGICRFSEGVATGKARLSSGESGILTAAHVAAGSEARAQQLRAGESVTVVADDGTRSDARLLLIDGHVMDAAVVAWPVGISDRWRVTKYDGYFPVRMMFPGGSVDAKVVEHTLPEGIIPGTLGRVRKPALLMTNRHGEPGDSGSLVYDLSNEPELGARPYLMYRGEYVVEGRDELPTTGLGECLMLEQIRIVWGVEFFD